MVCNRADKGIALLLQTVTCTEQVCARSAVTNAFDRTRVPPRLNGAAISPFDQFDAMPPSPCCPRRRTPMWFSRLEPHPTDHAAVDEVTFQCACGELLTQSLRR
jgi:hypothetical protein